MLHCATVKDGAKLHCATLKSELEHDTIFIRRAGNTGGMLQHATRNIGFLWAKGVAWDQAGSMLHCATPCDRGAMDLHDRHWNYAALTESVELCYTVLHYAIMVLIRVKVKTVYTRRHIVLARVSMDSIKFENRVSTTTTTTTT